MAKQDLRAFAEGVITHAKNGPRAIFKIDGEFKDCPQDGQYFSKIMIAYPNALVGIYDTRVKLNDLFSDLR